MDISYSDLVRFLDRRCDVYSIESKLDVIDAKVNVGRWFNIALVTATIGYFVSLSWSTRKLKSVDDYLNEADEAEEGDQDE